MLLHFIQIVDVALFRSWSDAAFCLFCQGLDIKEITKEKESKVEDVAKDIDEFTQESTVEEKTESVVKNTNSIVVPDKNDGKLAKSGVYVEYVDITNESEED